VTYILTGVTQTALPDNWRDLDRRIARLAVPALGAILAEPLYNLADTAIVGHLGRAPLDSLAIATSALSIVAWLAIFLSTATTTAVARNAARDQHAAAAPTRSPRAGAP
jgi:Na+-driven multidrug efflux pump